MRVHTRPRGAPGTADTDGGTGTPARSPYLRKAGLSGVVFALLLVASVLLVSRVPGLTASDREYQDFYAGGADEMVAVGLYLVPFAGIAALWHMTSTRMLLQMRRADWWADVAHWLHLAACVLFVAMLFAGAAAAGAPALVVQFSGAAALDPEVARGLAATGYTLVFVYGVRAAGMYMITTTALARRAGTLARWQVLVSYLAATALLVSTTFHPAVLLVFPVWVLLLSTRLLVRRPTGATS